MKQYIGIDLGGTNVRVGKVNEEGEITYVQKSPSFAHEGVEKVVSNIVEMLKNNEMADVEAIGIGLPGPIKRGQRIMPSMNNVEGCEGYPIAEVIEKEFGKPVYLINDANCAGLAEYANMKEKYDVMYYLTHSTGIGGALIVDGKVVEGYKGLAGEVGYINVVDSDVSYYDLPCGAIEGEAGGRALKRKGKQLIDEKIQGATEVFALAKSGNEIAMKIIDDTADYMAKILMEICFVVSPECIVIGGGCTKSFDVYYQPMIDKFNNYTIDLFKDIKIEKASCPDSGIIGAAFHSRNMIKEEH